MKPNAGIGKWSLDFVLKTVFFRFTGLDAGGTTGFVGSDFLVESRLTVLSAFAGFPFLPSPDEVFLVILGFFIFFCFFPLI